MKNNSNSYAWSIGKSKRGNLAQQDMSNPGPGNYNSKYQQVKKASQKYGIGTAKRDKNGNLMDVPGPGNYETAQSKIFKQSEAPLYSFAGKHNKTSPGMNPGPGQYQPSDISSKLKQPSYGMGAKTNLHQQFSNPGPGTYEAKSGKSEIFAKIGTEIRNGNLSTLAPGPGAYTKLDKQSQQKTPSHVFGTGKRAQSSYGGRNPGPGNYEVRKEMAQKNMGKTMSNRFDTKSCLNFVPGPGSYQPSMYNKQNLPNAKIGNEKQRKGNNLEQQRVPGPGTYENNFSHRPFTGNIKIGTSNRKPLNDAMGDNVPGPGAYNAKKKKGGPELTFKGVQSQQFIGDGKRSMPGPGNYNPSDYYASTKHRPTTAKIGTQPRGVNYYNHNPGPGNYQLTQTEFYKPNQSDLSTHFLKGKGPYWGFGSEKQRPYKDMVNSPGPCQYTLKTKVSELPPHARPQTANYNF